MKEAGTNISFAAVHRAVKELEESVWNCVFFGRGDSHIHNGAPLQRDNNDEWLGKFSIMMPMEPFGGYEQWSLGSTIWIKKCSLGLLHGFDLVLLKHITFSSLSFPFHFREPAICKTKLKFLFMLLVIKFLLILYFPSCIGYTNCRTKHEWSIESYHICW